MTAAALPGEARGSVNDRLVTTLFLAALFHAILILGVSFGAGGATDQDSVSTLEVLLVNDALPEARENLRADYLSQRTQQGSGNTQKLRRASNPSSSAGAFDNPGAADGNALTSQQEKQQYEAPQVLASWGDATQVMHLGTVTVADQGASQNALLLRSGEVAPLPSDDLGDSLVLKGERKGELLVTANTRESEVAVYLDRWRRKVERLGTLHFPQEVRRQGLSGSPVLEVAIRANGELEDMLVRRTSGYAELDRAALSILRLSSPFDPFPERLRGRHQVLRFAYEWQFLGGALVDSTVRAPTEP